MEEGRTNVTALNEIDQIDVSNGQRSLAGSHSGRKAHSKENIQAWNLQRADQLYADYRFRHKCQQAAIRALHAKAGIQL